MNATITSGLRGPVRAFVLSSVTGPGPAVVIAEMTDS